MNFLAIEENFIERKHYLLFLLFFIAAFALSVLLPISKVFLLIAGFSLVVAIFKIPEIGFSIFLLIGVIKGITQSLPVDFTLLVFLLTLFSLIFKLVSQKYKFNFANKYVFFFIIFVFILLLSNIYTMSPSSGFTKSIRFLVFNSFLFLGGICLGFNKKSRYRILQILHIIIFIYSLVYLYYLKDMIGMNFQELANYHLRLSLIGNPISVGRTFSILVLISVVNLFYENNTLRKIFYSFCIFAGLIITLSTNSRGPLVALLLTMLFYLIIFSGINKKKLFSVLVLIILFFVLILSFLPEGFVSRYKLFGNKELHVSEERVSVFSTFEVRENYLDRSLNYMSENPKSLLMGIGAGSFSYISANKDVTLYPHNIFAEILLELGIPVLLLFLLPFLFIIIDYNYLKKKIRDIDRKEIYLWMMLMIMFLLNAQVSGDINDNRILWFFQGGLIGTLLYLKKHKNELHKKNS